MACKVCHAKKKKCTPVAVAGKNACEYCITKGIPCEPHISQQGKRTDLERPSSEPKVVAADNGLASVGLPNTDDDTLGSIHCNDGIDGGSSVCSSECSSVHDADSDWEIDSACSSGSECSHRHHGSILGKCEITNTSNGNNNITMLKTYSRGRRHLFTAYEGGRFICYHIPKRFKISEEGAFTLITNTSMAYMSEGCNGRYIMYKSRGTDDSHWKFGIVASMHYLDSLQSDGTAHLFEWTGPLSPHGRPMFLDTTSWKDASQHFKYVTYQSTEIDFEFVNQVRGDTFDGSRVHPRTRNETDGGIQCNPDGPDKFPTAIKVPFMGGEPRLTLLLEKHKVDANVTGHPDLYQERKRKRGKRPQHKKARQNIESALQMEEGKQDEVQLAKKWQILPNKVVDKKQLQMIVVSSANYDDATTLNREEKQHYYAPTLSSVNNQSTPIVEFSGLTKEMYKELFDNNKEGININDYDSLISGKASSSHHLVDCYKIQPPSSVDASSYNGYIKIFGSKAAPTIDDDAEDVQTFHLPNTNTTIKCKFINAAKDDGHVPLSVGLIDSSFHRISIQAQHVNIINKAVGKGGLFTKRSRSGHHGSLTFVGPRAANSCSQPSPSEGPNEKGYWYYRQRMNHFYWPFVLHLMMYMASNITLLSYYQYSHLSKLLPLSNKDRLRQDFSDIGILTQDFNSQPHVDDDTLDAGMDEMFKKKLGLLSISDYITNNEKQRAKLALDHIEHWGLGTPTTCGYQVVVDEVSSASISNTKIKSEMNNVKSDNDEQVEIIQYFCCMGLGTCFRIRNYWTHMFLAFCFSHYTSVAIFVKGDRVYFGKYPGITMFAWGKGRDANKFGTYQPIVDGHRVRHSRRNTT